eukprot:scaffold47793_cov18-Prasinocladus_malaysianus.AAC.1
MKEIAISAFASLVGTHVAVSALSALHRLHAKTDGIIVATNLLGDGVVSQPTNYHIYLFLSHFQYTHVLAACDKEQLHREAVGTMRAAKRCIHVQRSAFDTQQCNNSSLIATRHSLKLCFSSIQF